MRTASRVAEIGERFAEPDLVVFALVKRGRALLKLARTKDGMALLDEAMIGLAERGSHRCWPAAVLQRHRGLPRGVRAAPGTSWTAALTDWCDAQPEMVNVPATARCIARRSCCSAAPGRSADRGRGGVRAAGRRYPGRPRRPGYLQGELRRLRGDLAGPRTPSGRRAAGPGAAAGAGAAAAGTGADRHRGGRSGGRRRDRQIRLRGPGCCRGGGDPAGRGDPAGAREAAAELAGIAGDAEVPILDALAELDRRGPRGRG